jgi:hypothetical protein
MENHARTTRKLKFAVHAMRLQVAQASRNSRRATVLMLDAMVKRSLTVMVNTARGLHRERYGGSGAEWAASADPASSPREEALACGNTTTAQHRKDKLTCRHFTGTETD